MKPMLASLLLGTLALPLHAAQDERPEWERNARKTIAEAELMVEADRDLEGAAEKLKAITQSLAKRLDEAPDDQRAKFLLVDATFMWVVNMDRLGKTDAAYAMLDDMLFGAARAGRDASPLQLAGATRAQEERLLTAHARLARRVEGDPEAAALSVVVGQDIVDQRVRFALESNNPGFIEQLGKRATPGLRQALHRDLDQLPSENQDAFHLLTRVDVEAASAFAGEHLEYEGFFWKKRLLRALEKNDVFQQKFAWEGPGDGATCRLTGFARSLETHLDDPDIGDAMLRLAGAFQGRGALTEPMKAALLAALEGDDRERAAIAGHVLSQRRGLTNMQPFYERLLASEDAGVRTLGADHLSWLDDCGALYEHAQDPSAEVRLHVARLLLDRRIQWYGVQVGRSSPNPQWHISHVSPAWDARDRATARTLIESGDPLVCSTVAEALEKMPRHRVEVDPGLRDQNYRYQADRFVEPLAAEVYVALARHPEEQIRRRIEGLLLYFDWDIRKPLIEVFVDEPLRAVAADAARTIAYGRWTETVDERLALLTRFLDRPDGAIGTRSEAVSVLISEFKRADVGLEAVTRWALARKDPDLVRQVVWERSSSQRIDEQLRSLPADLHAALTAAYFEQDPALGLVLARNARRHASAYARLAADTQQPVLMRYAAATAALYSRRDDASVGAALRAVFADPLWADPPLWLERDVVKYIGEIPPSLRNELLLQVLRSDTFEPQLAARLASEFHEDGEHLAPVVEAILGRWFDPADIAWFPSVENALDAMARFPEVVDADVLSRAARHGGYAPTAMRTIGTLKDPAYLPLIEDILRTERGTALFKYATTALPSYLSDEAAELLLIAAAGAQTQELRDWCMDQLENIREFQEARERWATRRVRVQTREEVVGELVLLLDDKDADIRVEAIRGLATWEAVEAMPRLIRLTKDTDASVAEAAKRALARLNEERDADGE